MVQKTDGLPYDALPIAWLASCCQRPSPAHPGPHASPTLTPPLPQVLSSYLEYNTSSTHSIVGCIIGFSLCYAGPSGKGWGGGQRACDASRVKGGSGPHWGSTLGVGSTRGVDCLKSLIRHQVRGGGGSSRCGSP